MTRRDFTKHTRAKPDNQEYRASASEVIARTDPLPVVQLEGGGAASFLRMPGVLPGTPEWVSVGDNRMIGKKSGIGATVVSIGVGTDGLLARQGSADIASLNAAASTILGRGSTGNLDFKTAGQVLSQILAAETAGTTFPSTNLYDGKPFYRTDLYQEFRYDSTAAGWLSVDTYTLHAGETANETGYFDLVPFNVPYTATNSGWGFPFDVKPVWMEAKLDLAVNSTCDIVIRDDGTNVTSATLSYSAETGRKSIEFLGGTIASGSNISIAVNSGTANYNASPLLIHAGFRRFET